MSGQLSVVVGKRKVSTLNLTVDPEVKISLDFESGTYMLLMVSLMAGLLIVVLLLFSVLVCAGLCLFNIYTKRLDSRWSAHRKAHCSRVVGKCSEQTPLKSDDNVV